MKRINALLGAAALLASLALPALSAEPEKVCGDGLTCIDQNWTDAQRIAWYTTTQGSRLFPLDWMLALERPGSEEKFLSSANMERLGYLAGPLSARNPYSLPLGFAIDHDQGRSADIMCETFPAACENRTMRKPWVGMTCAACHTNDITFQGTRIRVEGAATLADFEGFLAEFANAMDATLADETKFSRFASAVLGAADNGDERARLREQVEEQLYWRRRLEDKNNGNVAAGHGRLDAQSHILNKVALIASPSAPGEAPEDQPTNIRADAPASYPFIWNTDQQGKIQWNGIANNILKISLFGRQTDIGALVRNTSEVIGVFAHVEISRITDFFGYKSSLRLENMVLLERQLGELWSPRWPAGTFGALDQAKVARGDEIFDEKCASCHAHVDFDDTTTDKRPDGTNLELMSPLKEANTDIFLACNTYLHESNVYRFGGRRPFIYLIPGVEDNDKLPRRGLAPTRAMLVNGTVGSIIGDSDELVRSLAKDVFNSNRNLAQAESVTPLDAYLPGVDDTDKKQEAELCLSADGVAILAYKARPLNGIWATAPYLHNGSVPTLYDLLLPSRVRNSTLPHEAPLPAEDAQTRPERFMVGGREYDPVKGGFRTDQGPFEFRVRDDEGRPIPGNFNSGHDYGTADLSEDDRWALVEYLKSL